MVGYLAHYLHWSRKEILFDTPAEEVEFYLQLPDREEYEAMRYDAWLHDRADAIPERRIGDELETREDWKNGVALRRAQAQQQKMARS